MASNTLIYFTVQNCTILPIQMPLRNVSVAFISWCVLNRPKMIIFRLKMAESQEMASFTDDEGSSQDIQKVEEKSEVLESDDPILSAINRIEKIDEDSNFGPVDTDHFNIGTGIFIPARLSRLICVSFVFDKYFMKRSWTSKFRNNFNKCFFTIKWI